MILFFNIVWEVKNKRNDLLKLKEFRLGRRYLRFLCFFFGEQVKERQRGSKDKEIRCGCETGSFWYCQGGRYVSWQDLYWLQGFYNFEELWKQYVFSVDRKLLFLFVVRKGQRRLFLD